jgi:hypothetical protein
LSSFDGKILHITAQKASLQRKRKKKEGNGSPVSGLPFTCMQGWL